MGALGAETAPLLQALRRPRPHPRALRLVQGTLAGTAVAVLTCGVGPDKAARRLAEVLPLLPDLRALLSLGTCGALADDLPTGTLLTATALADAAGPLPAQDLLPWPAVRAASLVTVAKPVWAAADRAVLAAQGHHACEMEAAALRRAAPDLRFSTLKVVSDQAGAHHHDPPARPGPLDLARFKARALRLSAQHLLPAIRHGLPALSAP